MNINLTGGRISQNLDINQTVTEYDYWLMLLIQLDIANEELLTKDEMVVFAYMLSLPLDTTFFRDETSKYIKEHLLKGEIETRRVVLSKVKKSLIDKGFLKRIDELDDTTRGEYVVAPIFRKIQEICKSKFKDEVITITLNFKVG